MGKFSRLGNDLYTGEKSFDFIGRKQLWYAISGTLVLLCLAAVLVKGLNFGVEFTGGSEFKVTLSSEQATQANADKLRQAVDDADIAGAESPTVTTAGGSLLLTTEDLSTEDGDQVTQLITDTFSIPNPDESISQSEIGASWGQEVAKRAITGVIIFLILTMLFIAFYFREWKMSIAAVVALFHDIIITIGIYSLSGFQVTPSAVTGLLAILGFSLYDTVVVFDKVRENTHELRKSGQSYSGAANLAVNQTLVRSINTGIVALIPIGSILFVSAILLGASSLQDLALSQFVGMAVGVYSSVCLAPRVLVQLKGRETSIQEQERRAAARSKKRAAADRYATVPAVREDAPVGGRDLDPEGLDLLDDGEEPEELRDEPADRPARRPSGDGRTEAMGRGRTAPTNRREVGESGSSGRRQPTRTPKSQRKKP